MSPVTCSSHEFQLTIPGLTELEGMVRDFLENCLNFADFGADERSLLADATVSAVRLVEAAVESGGDRDLPVTLRAVVDDAAIEISILEHGRPLGSGEAGDFGTQLPSRIRPASVFDRVWWVQQGPQGSELHLRKGRPHPEISTLVSVQHRWADAEHERAEHESASAPAGAYRIRPFRDEDALEVARSIYEAYGYTYPNPDMFYPDRVVTLNRDGRLHSFIAEAEDGTVAGYYALERPDGGPIAEAGQAVIHHAHRGRGLMQQLRAAVETAGRELGLYGIWSQPTARHPYSQKMNLAFGSVPTGLSLATTPASTILRGNTTQETEPVRHSCFLYWHPLAPEPSFTASIPKALAPLFADLYSARGREVFFDTSESPPRESAAGVDAVHVIYDRARSLGRISVDHIGLESTALVIEAAGVLESVAGAEVLTIDLPLDDPACGWLSTRLMAAGFVPAGIGPRFQRRSANAEDTLRLQKPIAPWDRNGLVVEGTLGQKLADAILPAASY